MWFQVNSDMANIGNRCQYWKVFPIMLKWPVFGEGEVQQIPHYTLPLHNGYTHADEESHLQRHDRSVSMVMEKVVVPALFLTFSWRQIMMIFQLEAYHDNFSAGAKLWWFRDSWWGCMKVDRPRVQFCDSYLRPQHAPKGSELRIYQYFWLDNIYFT